MRPGLRRRLTILTWILWTIHLLANIEGWIAWKKKTGRVQWLPSHTDR